MPAPPVERLISHLWRPVEGYPPPQIYAILDGARSKAIYPKLASSDIDALSLYSGDQARQLAMVAPYLVYLDREDPFTHWLLTNGWGKSWGIFLESPAILKELRRHFRDFIIVYDEDATPLFFRYYDPRVLRVYLPTCNARELQIVFGPVHSFYVEDEDPTTVIEYSLADGKLAQRPVSLATGSA